MALTLAVDNTTPPDLDIVDTREARIVARTITTWLGDCSLPRVGKLPRTDLRVQSRLSETRFRRGWDALVDAGVLLCVSPRRGGRAGVWSVTDRIRQVPEMTAGDWLVGQADRGREQREAREREAVIAAEIEEREYMDRIVDAYERGDLVLRDGGVL